MYFLKLQLRFCFQVTTTGETPPASEDTRVYKIKGKNWENISAHKWSGRQNKRRSGPLYPWANLVITTVAGQLGHQKPHSGFRNRATSKWSYCKRRNSHDWCRHSVSVCTCTDHFRLISQHMDTQRVQFISSQMSRKGQMNHSIKISISIDKKGRFGNQLSYRHTPDGYRQRTVVSAFLLQSLKLNFSVCLKSNIISFYSAFCLPYRNKHLTIVVCKTSH